MSVSTDPLAPKPGPSLVCEGVTRVFRQGDEQVYALRDVSVSIGRGEFVAIAGPSGSGKTTLLNLAGGLD